MTFVVQTSKGTILVSSNASLLQTAIHEAVRLGEVVTCRMDMMVLYHVGPDGKRFTVRQEILYDLTVARHQLKRVKARAERTRQNDILDACIAAEAQFENLVD